MFLNLKQAPATYHIFLTTAVQQNNNYDKNSSSNNDIKWTIYNNDNKNSASRQKLQQQYVYLSNTSRNFLFNHANCTMNVLTQYPSFIFTKQELKVLAKLIQGHKSKYYVRLALSTDQYSAVMASCW